MLKPLDESIKYQLSLPDTDAFWDKEHKASLLLNVSTVDNYDEETGVFFPLEHVETSKEKGLFMLTGGNLYKVDDR